MAGVMYLVGPVRIFPTQGPPPSAATDERKNWSNELKWNHEQEEEFETARRVLSDSSQMIRPFDPSLALGLVVDTAKTTGIGYILFQFNPRYPVAVELLDPSDDRAGPMNFYLQGAWSVVTKGSWADLAPLERLTRNDGLETTD